MPALLSSPAITVVPSGAPLGAEIRGVDIAAGVDEATHRAIRDALHRHKVVVLRGQAITPEQQIAFCGGFGALEPHVLPQYLVPGYRELVRVSNVLDEQGQPSTYTVAPGDVEAVVAERLCAYPTLGSMNHRRDIHPGQVLWLTPDPAVPWIPYYGPADAPEGFKQIPYQQAIERAGADPVRLAALVAAAPAEPPRPIYLRAPDAKLPGGRVLEDAAP